MKTFYINLLAGIFILVSFVQCQKVTGPDTTVESEENITAELVSPTNNSTGESLQVELKWKKIRGGKEYQIRLATDQNIDSTLIDTSTQGTSYTTPTLEPGTTYYWQVKPLERNGYWSEIWHFTTSDGSTNEQTSTTLAVTLISPEHGASDLAVPVAFEWEAISGISSYQIQIAEGNSFSTLTANASVSGTTYESSGVENGKTY
ncbi:hypothetical protein G3570_16205, partial [Balneolaceae bacterium YR4-1]